MKVLRVELAWVMALVVGCGEDARVSLRAPADASAEASARCVRAEDCDDGDRCTTDLCVLGNVCEHERVGGCVSPRRCVRAGDCDDGVACTRDRCLVTGLCDSVADDGLCAVGARCDVRVGCEGLKTDGGAADVSRALDAPAAVDAPVVRVDVGSFDAGAVPDRAVPTDIVAAADVSSVVDVPAVTDAGLDPRSGVFNLLPVMAYACQDEVFKVPVLSLAIATLTLNARSDGATVSWPGGSVELRGPAIASGSLRVTGTIPHPDCSATLTLNATFPDPTRIAGSLALSFTDLGCVLTSCESRTLTFQGVRMR